jgi:NAD(P)-dependent dehydrogenase (short-subunit alcohol dehydrogenase family)
MGILDGKVAIITGATAGIGEATARLFAAEGAKVLLAARRVELGEAVAASIRAAGGDALFQQTDVAQGEDHLALVDTALGTWGRLDIAFNNAGISHLPSLIADFDRMVWDQLVAVNLTGVMLAMKAQIPALIRSGGTSIINNASVSGLRAYPGSAAYCTTKHALIGLTRVAAQELAPYGIRANVLCPGGTETPMFLASGDEFRGSVKAMTPLGRFAEPIEQARVALFLASEASSYMTGAVLPVDGGLTMG